MKIKVLAIIFALSIYGNNVYAQHHINDSIAVNGIAITNIVAKQTGSMLSVEMNINGEKARISSKEKKIITPIIKSGEQSLKLSPVIISGNNRYKADKRALYFNRQTNLSETYKKSESSNLHYTNEVTFEPWMSNAVLIVKQETYGCAACKENEGFSSVVSPIETSRSKPEVKFTVSYIVPPTELVKNRNDQGTAHLDFHVGKSVIIPEFKNNYQELSKIEKVLDQITNNSAITITSIYLKGYASPEGSSVSNARLSSERANALRDYLQIKYPYNTGSFEVSSGGEDWGGLGKLIRESNLTDKEELLVIIESPISEDAKEQRFKSYPNSYKILLDDYYPTLRRVDYQVNYVVRAFSAEEGRTIIKTNPGQLSLNEMYLVANTYERGSEDFKEVFDIAVRLYPDDTIANLNAAAIELENENISSAHRYLDKYIQVPETWNNAGILYALEGNLSKAKEFLLKAKENGSIEANENLSKLKLLEDPK